MPRQNTFIGSSHPKKIGRGDRVAYPEENNKPTLAADIQYPLFKLKKIPKPKMNITLIIGNGFDLNLGLPTDYEHFYEYYLSPKTGSKERLITQEIKKDLSDWADLESQLGKISIKYKEDDKAYINDIDHISDELTRYLKTVNSFCPRLEEAARTVYNDLCDFSKYLDIPMKKNLESFIQEVPNKDEIHFDVITFNYTDIFERIFDCWKTLPVHGKIKEYTLSHIHQKLDEKGILLGVNHASQIANQAFRNNYYVLATIVKPFIYKNYQSEADQACEKAIQQAHIIILFGVSMGETDQCWWEFIGNKMINTSKRLIYCPFDNQPTTQTNRILRRNRDFMDFVVNRMPLDANSRLQVHPKIIPLRERRMFDFHTTERQLEMNFEKTMLMLK